MHGYNRYHSEFGSSAKWSACGQTVESLNLCLYDRIVSQIMQDHLWYIYLLVFSNVIFLSKLSFGMMTINLTGAQLRHNDFRIFADPSRIFTYNYDETFKTTSRTLGENMPGHA